MLKFNNMVIVRKAVAWGLFLLVVLVSACELDEDPQTEYPDSYLPAYPGSYWDYNNGERILTSPTYELHSYEYEINSTKKTSEVYVPVYNGQYLYTYSVYQNSTQYPLKKLLDEKTGEKWVINDVNNSPVIREVTHKLDTFIIPFPPHTNPVDCVFTDVIVVVEYIETFGVDKWNVKEYYADSVGLIQVEVNDPFDTTQSSIVQKQINGYYINW